MQSRTYPKEVVDQILRHRHGSRAESLMAQSKTDTPNAGTDDARRAWARARESFTASQRAMLASQGVWSEHGGDRTSPHKNLSTVERQAERHDCSPRLVKMAIKLRKVEGKRMTLLRAVASGTIGLGDALAYVDRSTPELRKAIKQVEQRKARSLRQALAL
jgi:hypothetical protein